MTTCCLAGRLTGTNGRRLQYRSHLSFFLAVLWTCMLCTYPAAALAGAEEFPTPLWLEKVTVAEQMTINGLSSSVQYFEAYREVEDLLEFYRRKWRSGNRGLPGYREAEALPWHVISRIEDGHLYTVQVQEDGELGIKGYLSVGDLKKAGVEKDPGSRVPRMKGSRILNYSTSTDNGQQGETLMLVNDFSLESNSEFYRRHYRSRGWATLVDMESEEARVLSFRKFNREANLVIHHLGDDTQIVMNVVTFR